MWSKKFKYQRVRLLVQAGAFLVILLNPLVIYYSKCSFVQGWYQSLAIGKLWFVSPLEGLESILVSKTVYFPLFIGLLPPVILALFLGRVFCGWICPINFLSSLVDRVFKRQGTKDQVVFPLWLIWFSLIGELMFSMIIGAPLFVFLSPPGLVGREIMMVVFFHTLALEGVIIVVVLALNLVTKRFFCRYLCPLGALLALLGARRRLIVKLEPEKCKGCRRCGTVCPLGLAPQRGQAQGPYCWNCGTCIDACPHQALTFFWRCGGEHTSLHRGQNDTPPQGG